MASSRVRTSGLRTSGLRTGRLKLRPLRSRESAQLDGFEHERRPEGVPFIDWRAFNERLEWKQGEHITLVGRTGSGKTTLARQLLPRRDFVVVLATKRQDPSLYDPLLAAGYVLRETFDPDIATEPKVIYRPPLPSPTPEGREVQREAFREALISIFEVGGWCVYMDEIRYLSETLKLGAELEILWLQGRSLGVSMVCGTQRPVSIPRVAFEAQHLFLWKFTDKRDIVTMSEFTGENLPVAQALIPRLPKHEALYIDTDTDEILRTKVSL